MDDVDAVQAQIARNMLQSGDWVTARLNGVAYLEKSPLIYWMMAVSLSIFGVHDWAARIPLAFCTIALCWVTYRIGRWAFGERAGFYAGLVHRDMHRSVSLHPDPDSGCHPHRDDHARHVGVLRALDESEPQSALVGMLWAAIGDRTTAEGTDRGGFSRWRGASSICCSRGSFAGSRGSGCVRFTGIAIALGDRRALARPGDAAQSAVFRFHMHSEPGQYHGFFWFYFLNEHVLRFLNMRYPRDYNTVPRHLFWLFHLLWLFPWSVYLPPACAKLQLPADGPRRPDATAGALLGRLRAGVLHVFDDAGVLLDADLSGAGAAAGLRDGDADRVDQRGTQVIAVVAALAALAIAAILWHGAGPADAGRHLERADIESGCYTRFRSATWAI